MPEDFFQRFRWSDPTALEHEIAEARAAYIAAHEAATDVAAEIECACRLGVALTAADREAETSALLDGVLAKARVLAEPASIAWAILTLATARQYLGERALAQTMFGEALEMTASHGLRDIEHYVLHHRGRCYAEQGNISEARSCFEQALKIRLELGEPRAERSRQALAALDDL